MAKKNLPNIPLYIGDWEKDCNVLSLRTEAAWLRIIFKMFTNGKQSSYKIPTKGLQNLWKVSKEEVQEIIEELTDYDICIINIDGRFTEFTSRRFLKENEISDTRKKAVSKRKDRTKPLQTTYKTSTKHIQNTEIENENESDNEDNTEKYFGKFENLLDLENEKDFIDQIAKYFSQTTSELKENLQRDLTAIFREGKYNEFKKQTEAYIEFKILSKQTVHTWLGYKSDWRTTDWIHKLDTEKAKNIDVKKLEVITPQGTVTNRLKKQFG